LFLKIKTADVAGYFPISKNNGATIRATGPFSYYFVDEQFASLYSAEQRTGIFTSFAVIAVIIAGLAYLACGIYDQTKGKRDRPSQGLGASL